MKALSGVRVPRKGKPYSIAAALVIGLAAGAAARLLDIRTEFLGNLFSRLPVWILICTALSVYSASPAYAAAKVFCFCAGMLCTYYLTAELTHGVYGMSFVCGWCAVTLLSPLAAAAAWYAGGQGPAARIIGAGIISVMLLSAWLLSDRIRFSDLVCAALCAPIVFRRAHAA